MNGLDADATRVWVEAFLDAAEREVDRLGELDRASGDGDFGTNLTTSIRRARGILAELANGLPRDFFLALSQGFMGTGGTSGPLYGMWFRDLARAAAESTELSARELSAGAAAGLSTVRRLGGAGPGDKTMVDAMHPASEALSRSAENGDGPADALAVAARAASDGADATAALVARKGRATWVGEVSRGIVDPGAETVALFFESGATCMISYRKIDKESK